MQHYYFTFLIDNLIDYVFLIISSLFNTHNTSHSHSYIGHRSVAIGSYKMHPALGFDKLFFSFCLLFYSHILFCSPYYSIQPDLLFSIIPHCFFESVHHVHIYSYKKDKNGERNQCLRLYCNITESGT